MPRQVTGGATNVTTYFALRKTADGKAATGLTITDFDLQYVRSGAAPSAKVDATALAATDSAHADNKAIEIDATDQPGLYRVDWPDAAFAGAVPEVILTVKVATVFTEHLAVQIDSPVNLTTIDKNATAAGNLKSAGINYTVTRGYTGTALPAAVADAVGGVPISDAGGLDLDAKLAELAAANLPADVDALLARLTAARAGYLDKLNITGNVAASGEVTAIQNNTRVRVVVPSAIERPDSGSTDYKFHLYIYDLDGNMEAPDSTPTISAENQAGTDRSGNLGTVTLEDTGHYSVTYTVASDHAIEQVLFEWSVIENSVTRLHGTVAQVVDTTAVDYTAADRTRDDGIAAKTVNLPGSPAAVGSEMNLADDAITAAKHDETTAFPLESADTGSTQVARTGADSDTLKSLSDQLDAVSGEESRSRSGTAQGGTSSTITLDAGASAQDNIYKHGICYIHTGTGAEEFQIIDSYVGSTKVATMAANWVITPDNTSQFRILPLGTIPGASAPTAAQVADAVLTELIADHKATAGSLAAVANEIHCAAAPKKIVANKSNAQSEIYDRDGITLLFTEEVAKDSDDEVKVTRV